MRMTCIGAHRSAQQCIALQIIESKLVSIGESHKSANLVATAASLKLETGSSEEDRWRLKKCQIVIVKVFFIMLQATCSYCYGKNALFVVQLLCYVGAVVVEIATSCHLQVSSLQCHADQSPNSRVVLNSFRCNAVRRLIGLLGLEIDLPIAFSQLNLWSDIGDSCKLSR